MLKRKINSLGCLTNVGVHIPHQAICAREDRKVRWYYQPPVRVNGKEWKTQHQIPEFGPKHDEIKKKPAKKYISLQEGVKLRTAPFFW